MPSGVNKQLNKEMADIGQLSLTDEYKLNVERVKNIQDYLQANSTVSIIVDETNWRTCKPLAEPEKGTKQFHSLTSFRN